MSDMIQYEPEQLRLLQLNELDLLIEFDHVCRVHNIHYSLDGGTLLGAIRHKGFIPWDDDIDVMMIREDYERLVEACREGFCNEKYFFQDYRTDEGYRWGYGKLRNLNTEYIKSGHEHSKYKTGVCIDIFVLENIPDSVIAREWFLLQLMCLRKILYSDIGRFQAGNSFLRKWYRLLYQIPKDNIFKCKENISSHFGKKRTKNVINATLPFPKKECRYGYPASFFDEYIEVEFEGMQFMSISSYDSFLKMKYDDYIKLPPVESRVGVMNASILELEEMSLEELNIKYRNYKGNR